MPATSSRNDAIHLPNFPRLIFLTLREEGYSENDLVGGLDITSHQLSDEKFRLSVGQHEQFVLRALETTGDPHLALQILRSNATATYSLPLMAIINSGQVAKAIDLIIRYNKIFTRALTVRAAEAGGDVWVALDPNMTNPRVVYFALSSFVLFLDLVFRDALNGAHLVRKVEMAIPEPEGFDQVRGDFGFPVTFHHEETRAFLDPSLLDKPLRQADPQTVRLLMEICDRQLAEAEAEETFEASVTSYLIKHISAPPRLDEAARALGVSPRGLRRKLEQAGTTYQKSLESIRLRLATQLLEDTRDSISSIAYELGFESASHFARAFRRWTGQSPTSYRKSAPE